MARLVRVVFTGDDIGHLLTALSEAAEHRELLAAVMPDTAEVRLSSAIARKYRKMADTIEDSLPMG